MSCRSAALSSPVNRGAVSDQTGMRAKGTGVRRIATELGVESARCFGSWAKLKSLSVGTLNLSRSSEAGECR